jgi:hypothetical protein
MTAKLIWVKSLTGPTIQLMPEDSGMPMPPNVIDGGVFKITDQEYDLSFEELMAKYPCPVVTVIETVVEFKA